MDNYSILIREWDDDCLKARVLALVLHCFAECLCRDVEHLLGIFGFNWTLDNVFAKDWNLIVLWSMIAFKVF